MIMTGTRAYLIRDDLRAYNWRLLEYVEAGGTMVVQYNKFNGNLAALSFLAFTTFNNLIPSALSHHEWYLQKFDDYPSERRAVFPFVL